MSKLSGIYWMTPVAIFSSLIVGVLFSLSHHLFYMHLAGTDVPIVGYSIAGYQFSKQQLNISAGNIFAYLVKTALAIALSLAYIQAAWRTVKVSKKGETLSTLDATFSIIEDAFGFFKVKIWYKYPLLLSIAIVSWCIPIASIVTPATLSVENVMKTSSSMSTVPKLDFTSLDFVAPMPWELPDSQDGPINDGEVDYCYLRPSQEVARLAIAVGAQGEILSFLIPQHNASWTINFWAPSLQCTNASASERQAVWENVFNYLNQDFDVGSACEASFGYLAWVPTNDSILPFVNVTGSLELRTNTLTYGSPTSLYIATIPDMFTNSLQMSMHANSSGCLLVDEYGDKGQKDVMAGFFDNASLFGCGFGNSSYSANISYTNGIQNIEASIARAASPIVPQACIKGPVPPNSPFSDSSLGYETADANCSTFNMDGEPCNFDLGLVRTVAYQSVIDAFIQLLQGSISLIGPIPIRANMSSNIIETVLIETDDLAFIQEHKSGPTYQDLATILGSSNGTLLRGLSNAKTAGTRGSLAQAVEEMFKNLTLSLMSNQYLQPNYSSPFAPPATANVTFTTFQNIYVYSASTLWIAYGLSIGFTTMAVAIGFVAMLSNGASYDSNFSTILRVGRIARLGTEVIGGEDDGRQPLPKHLVHARLLMRERPEVPPKSSSSVQTADVEETLLDETGTRAP